MQYTHDIIKKIYHVIPDEIDVVITDEETLRALSSIREKYHLSKEQQNDLGDEVTMRLIGLTTSDQFSKSVEDRLKLTQETTSRVVEDVRTSVLSKISGNILRAQEEYAQTKLKELGNPTIAIPAPTSTPEIEVPTPSAIPTPKPEIPAPTVTLQPTQVPTTSTPQSLVNELSQSLQIPENKIVPTSDNLPAQLTPTEVAQPVNIPTPAVTPVSTPTPAPEPTTTSSTLPPISSTPIVTPAPAKSSIYELGKDPYREPLG